MSSEGRLVTDANAQEVADWCGGLPVIQYDALDDKKVIPGVNVPVGDGTQRASVGDVVIRNHDGTFQIFKG